MGDLWQPGRWQKFQQPGRIWGSKEKRGSRGQIGPAHLRGSCESGMVLIPRKAHLSLRDLHRGGGTLMGWRAALGVPSPYPLGPESYLRLLSPPAPLCLSWYKGHEREWEGGKSRPVEGTFTGLEDQGKHLLFSGPLSPKQPSEAPGLVLHNFQGPLHLRRSCGHNRGSLWG